MCKITREIILNKWVSNNLFFGVVNFNVNQRNIFLIFQFAELIYKLVLDVFLQTNKLISLYA